MNQGKGQTSNRAWALVETYDVSPAIAMGLDEALLRSVGRRPTLRLYTWAPDALSLGYFQRASDVPAAAAHPRVVRRLTGGGAIHHHAGELTFSITLDANDSAYAGTVPDSYVRTHEAIARALWRFGADGARMRTGERCNSDRPGTGMCFHESTPLDVCWPLPGGIAKGVGTAQRRTDGRILHHGSIKLAGSALEPGVATLEALGKGTPPHREVARALVRALGDTFRVQFEDEEIDRPLARSAKALGERYADPAFVHRAIRGRA